MKSVSPNPVLPAISNDVGERVGDVDERVEGQRDGDEPAGGAEAQPGEGSGVEEEAVLRKALPSPYMPSVSEIRQHKTTHLP